MAKTKIKEVKVDHASFNADHYAGISEADFIKAEMGGVPDRIGDDEAKKAWLKEAYKKVVGKPASQQPSDTGR